MDRLYSIDVTKKNILEIINTTVNNNIPILSYTVLLHFKVFQNTVTCPEILVLNLSTGDFLCSRGNPCTLYSTQKSKRILTMLRLEHR